MRIGWWSASMYRAAKIFVLAIFINWTTGLGQYLHEKYEHHHPDQAEAAIAPGRNGEKPLKEADDHDDCNICNSLKAMTAHSPDSPKAPEPSLPSFETPFALHWDAPVLAFVVFIPARAPPTASASA
jgi:hypothetical protein